MAKFRDPSGNRLYTRSLFLEMLSSSNNNSETDTALYTLKPYDYKGLPSLKRLYLEMEDETEYNFAYKYFESYDHWMKIQELSWMKDLIAEWRHELQIKIKAGALTRIKVDAKSNSKSAFQANRYLLEKGWVDKEEKRRVGRPSKAEIHKAIKEKAEEEERWMKDADRIKLIVNNS